MENEKMDQPQDELQTEADLEAQRWLEELLAATEAAAEAPVEEPSPDDGFVPEMDNSWFEQLESPAEAVQEIGTDEGAVASHGMSDLADMELNKIIDESKSEDWDVAAIENEILSGPIESAFDEEEPAQEDEEDVYSDEQPEPDPDAERKVRPKRKNSYGLFGLPHLASVAIWAAICITIGISLGRLVWVCASDILAFGRPDQDVEITILAEDDLDAVTQKLYEKGLIKYRELFKLYAKLAQVEEKGKISSGTFTLNTMYDYHALVGGLSATSSYRETTEVVIPEGFTCAQIFELLEERGVCTVAALEEYCTQSEFASYWFLEDVEKGTKYCLEGFLFPDTYEFYTNSTPQLVFIKLLSGFNNHFTPEMVAQLDVLNASLKLKYEANGAAEKFVPLTVKDVVTIASMIEKETAYSGESPTIASVIYNRLTNPYEYPKLNIDATIVYALGGKKDLTAEDLKFDSPYNTYLYEGLPPGPISNPGAFSLRAALEPAETPYYFYALDPTAEFRSHKFFRNRKEHEDFLESIR